MSAGVNNSNAKRENNVNFLRFIAAFMVLYAHMAKLLGLESPKVLGLDFGAIAVNIFFLLSGYLIAGSWKRSKSFKSYLIRRIARIFPALIVVVLLLVFVLGPLLTTLTFGEYFSNRQTWLYLLEVVFVPVKNELPGVFEGLPYPNAVNGSLWTLRYEFFAYLMTPIFYYFARRITEQNLQKRKVAFGFMLTMLAVLYFLEIFDILAINLAFDELIRLSFFYFVGVVVNEFGLTKLANAQWAIFALLLMLIFNNESGPLAYCLMVILIIIFTVNFSFCQQPAFGNCFKTNDFSYGIYIYAFPIQQCVVLVGGGSLPSPVISCTGISFLITLVFAAVSWFLIEKPAIAFGKKVSNEINMTQ